MAALTILEAAKRMQGTLIERAVVEIFARQAPILEFLPFRDIPGNAIKYNREESLPGVAFRGVNEGFTPSPGVLNPVVESLVIVGGEITVDRFIARTEGPDARAIHESMKMKNIAESFQTKFFKGDVESDPKEFDGLQTRLTGTQLIDAGATSGGDALSLAKLDELIDACIDPQFLAMNKTMARRLTAAARDTTVGGFVNFTQDQFGRRQMTYNDLRVLIIETLDGQDTVLPFTEANPGGGGPASTSVYCMSFGPDRVTGLQNGGIDVRDLGEQDASPLLLTRIEWYTGIMIRHGRAAARLQGIKNAAIVK